MKDKEMSLQGYVALVLDSQSHMELRKVVFRDDVRALLPNDLRIKCHHVTLVNPRKRTVKQDFVDNHTKKCFDIMNDEKNEDLTLAEKQKLFPIGLGEFHSVRARAVYTSYAQLFKKGWKFQEQHPETGRCNVGAITIQFEDPRLMSFLGQDEYGHITLFTDYHTSPGICNRMIQASPKALDLEKPLDLLLSGNTEFIAFDPQPAVYDKQQEELRVAANREKPK